MVPPARVINFLICDACVVLAAGSWLLVFRVTNFHSNSMTLRLWGSQSPVS